MDPKHLAKQDKNKPNATNAGSRTRSLRGQDSPLVTLGPPYCVDGVCMSCSECPPPPPPTSCKTLRLGLSGTAAPQESYKSLVGHQGVLHRRLLEKGRGIWGHTLGPARLQGQHGTSRARSIHGTWDRKKYIDNPSTARSRLLLPSPTNPPQLYTARGPHQ